MKIDKDDLYIYGFISGLIICSPLISVYYGTKWIYNHTPQKVKEKKERDLKIHELEEKLGLIGRDNKALYYDPHYYRNRNKNRNDYLVDLKKKVDCNYNSPDIITVIVESTFGDSHPGSAHLLELVEESVKGIGHSGGKGGRRRPGRALFHNGYLRRHGTGTRRD